MILDHVICARIWHFLTRYGKIWLERLKRSARRWTLGRQQRLTMLKHSISQTRTCIGNKLRNGTKIQAGIGCVSSAASCREAATGSFWQPCGVMAQPGLLCRDGLRSIGVRHLDTRLQRAWRNHVCQTSCCFCKWTRTAKSSHSAGKFSTSVI